MDFDAHGAWPGLRTFLSRAAWTTCPFDNLRRSLERRLASHPPLVDPLGYAWVLEPSAYEFPAEALNQVRILAALTGLNAQDRGANIAARLANVWDFGQSFGVPRAASREGWHFIVVPFGWDNLLYLVFATLLAHARHRGRTPAFLTRAGSERPWEPAAKGLMLATLTIGASDVAQPAVMADIRAEVPWFADAAIGLAETPDAGLNALWSLVMDFTINHEVAHLLYHSGNPQPAPAERARLEVEADHVALDAYRGCRRPRYLDGLAPTRSDGFYDAVSVILFYLCLGYRALVRQVARRADIASETDSLRTRTATLFDSYHRMSRLDPDGLPTEAEWIELRQLTDACEAFGRDLEGLLRSAPADAMAAAAACADRTRRRVERDLEDYAAGRLVLPDALMT